MEGTNTEASDAPAPACDASLQLSVAKRGAQVNTCQMDQENGNEELNDRGRPWNERFFWVPFQNLTVHFLEDRE